MKIPYNKNIDFGSQKKLQELIDKWRTIVGVDPIYQIHLKVGITEEPDLANSPAWMEGLNITNVHPDVRLCINNDWLQHNRSNEYEINLYIIHELLHIVIYNAFIMIDRDYEHTGLKAFANEMLTMKMANAIMTTYMIQK